MQIKIPQPIYKVYRRFEEWINQSILIRRIDILILLAFILGAIWSFYSGGWIVLAEFAALFIFIVLCCLWMG